MTTGGGHPLTRPAATVSPIGGEGRVGIPRTGISRVEPLNRNSRRKEAHCFSGEASQSLLTSAATRFIGRGRLDIPPFHNGYQKSIALGFLLMLLAGCQSGAFTHYISPQISGRVLAADTRQPLAGANVARITPQPSEAFGPPKGGQVLMQSSGV